MFNILFAGIHRDVLEMGEIDWPIQPSMQSRILSIFVSASLLNRIDPKVRTNPCIPNGVEIVLRKFCNRICQSADSMQSLFVDHGR